MILDQLIYTVADGSREASYITPILDANGVVQRYERSSQNFSAQQDADFQAGINSASAAQIIAANDAKIAAESALATEQAAHTATQALLDTANTELATTQTALADAQAKLTAAGIV